MEVLGFSSMHYDTKRLWDVVCGLDTTPDFRVYDDIDVISDLPAPLYLSGLMTAYPDAKVILTIRDTEAWWRSISSRYKKHPIKPVSFAGRMAMKAGLKTWPRKRYDRTRMFKTATRELAYGSTAPHEQNYKMRYERHNRRVMDTVPADKLLVMDVCAGDGWEQLCPFVGREVPSVEFPYSNVH
jgi:hypothetical protein